MNARAARGKIMANKAAGGPRNQAGCAKFNISASAACHPLGKLSLSGR